MSYPAFDSRLLLETWPGVLTLLYVNVKLLISFCLILGLSVKSSLNCVMLLMYCYLNIVQFSVRSDF